LPLMPMSQILKEAEKRGYAVGYFESWDYGSLEASLRAAEEAWSPVIIGFGGRTFVQDSGWDEVKLTGFAAIGKELVKNSTVPTAFILNEVSDPELIKRAMRLGFNCVMFDGSGLALEDNIESAKEIVKQATKLGIDVEGQVGRIPSQKERINRDFLTDPEVAGYFVHQTGVNALAISVGNVHMLIHKEFSVDWHRLEKIDKLVNVPLVMHGGTGFPDKLIKKVINKGVHKFNVGTILKKVFLEELRKNLTQKDLDRINPQELIDSTSERDILKKACSSIKETIKTKLEAYGSAGKVKM